MEKAEKMALKLPAPLGQRYGIKRGVMDATKAYKSIGFGAMDATKPYKFIRFGTMEGKSR